MQIKIHRGIDQIGGCITEIATSKSRILIDLGMNLPDSNGKSNDDLANPTSIKELTQGVDAVFYTHYHGDHVGLMEYVPNDVEQYIGDIAKKVLKIKAKYLKQDPALLESLKTFVKQQRIEINGGDIVVTPYFVSHSAADSFMFLIKSDGKRILHSGDFRDHGYLGKGLFQFVPKHIGEVDVLITEGTMLSRSSDIVKSEYQLQQELKEYMQKHKYIFVIGSSTDIDRLATLHKANPKERLFVCDRYQKDILDIFTANGGEYSSLYKFGDLSIFPKDKLLNEMLSKGFCMMVRPNQFTMGKYWKFTQMTLNLIPKDKRVVIYSMWGGYLDRECVKNKYHVGFIEKFEKREHRVHTSGHASAECLAELCSITNPRIAIIPIHSERSADYLNLPISDELKSKVTLKSKTINGISIII